MDLLLPFKIGDLAELRSFQVGYRSAWFRCKVHDMRINDSAGYLEYYLEYIDYSTEQEKEWIRAFEENPTSSNQNSRESSQLMIRPSFPQWYYGHEVPEQFPNSDVTAIVDEAWKVGDLVDWFTTGCYWSGTITKLLGKNMVEIKLPPPPIGEGICYRAKCNDLRPTLEWSLTKGWTVPLSQAKRNRRHAARLLQHSKSESDKSTSDEESSSDDEYGDNGGGVQQSGCRTTNVSRTSCRPGTSIGQKQCFQPKSSRGWNYAVCREPEAQFNIQTTRAQPWHSICCSQQQTCRQRSFCQAERISIKQEQEGPLTVAEADDDGPDEFLEKVDKLQSKLDYLMERTQVGQECCTEVLASCRGSSKDAVSGK